MTTTLSEETRTALYIAFNNLVGPRMGLFPVETAAVSAAIKTGWGVEIDYTDWWVKLFFPRRRLVTRDQWIIDVLLEEGHQMMDGQYIWVWHGQRPDLSDYYEI